MLTVENVNHVLLCAEVTRLCKVSPQLYGCNGNRWAVTAHMSWSACTDGTLQFGCLLTSTVWHGDCPQGPDWRRGRYTAFLRLKECLWTLSHHINCLQLTLLLVYTFCHISDIACKFGCCSLWQISYVWEIIDLCRKPLNLRIRKPC